MGGQVVGGLVARTVEQKVTDPDLVPARLTVYDAHGPIGAGVTTSAANPHFVGTPPKA